MRKFVLVRTRGGKLFRGVRRARTGLTIWLDMAELIRGPGDAVPMAGTVIIARDNVEWVAKDAPPTLAAPRRRGEGESGPPFPV